MLPMSAEAHLNELKVRLAEISDLQAAIGLLSWDQATHMPPAAGAARGRQLATLSRFAHQRFIDPEIGRLLERLEAHGASLPPESDDAALIRVVGKDYHRAVVVPPAFSAEFNAHAAESYQLWAEARSDGDFARVADALAKTIDLSRRFAELFPGYAHVADPLIDQSDEGMTVAALRPLFARLREALVPLVEAIGGGVDRVAIGDRVAWAFVAGSYAEYVVAPADQLLPVPAGVSLEQAAAAMLQGMTAHYLCHSTYPLRGGQWCLIHAGAGGVGLLLTQMCKIIGAKVITTVSTEAKAQLSRGAGADEVINYTAVDFANEVARITAGQGVSVVFDGVGKATSDGSLRSLSRRGMLALFGNASGAPDPIEPLLLTQLGSLFLTRPSLGDYTATRTELEWRAGDIFGWLADGRLHLRMEIEYPLAEAATAHDMLEGRKTTGKVLLKT